METKIKKNTFFLGGIVFFIFLGVLVSADNVWDTDNECNITGDITYEDVEIFILCDVNVSGNLTLNRVVVTFNQSENFQYEFLIEDTGIFNATDVLFRENETNLYLIYFDGTTLWNNVTTSAQSFLRFRLPSVNTLINSTFGFGGEFGGGTTNILIDTNSIVGGKTYFGGDSNSSITRGWFNYLIPNPAGNINVTNLMSTRTTGGLINNYVFSSIGYILNFTDVNVSYLGFDGLGDSTFIIVNSSFNFHPSFSDGNTIIANGSYFAGSWLELDSANITFVKPYSNITDWAFGSSNENPIISGYYYLEGGIAQYAGRPRWGENTLVNRFYPIYILNESTQNPLEGINVSFFNGTTFINEDLTDGSGYVNLNITFTNDSAILNQNYTVFLNGTSYINITFLTNNYPNGTYINFLGEAEPTDYASLSLKDSYFKLQDGRFILN